MVRLTNKSGVLLVCDLNSKENPTLRVKNGKSVMVKETEVTKHIENLVRKGLVLKEEVPDGQKKVKEKEE